MIKFFVYIRTECKDIITDKEIKLTVMACNETEACQKVQSMFQPWVHIEFLHIQKEN